MLDTTAPPVLALRSEEVAECLCAVYVDGTITGPLSRRVVTDRLVHRKIIRDTDHVSVNQLLTGLSQGSHSLSLEYKSVFGQSVSFEEVVITAIPH
jgi:hypothetical protein